MTMTTPLELRGDRPMTDVMIDLETLSTRPDAAILSIGAVMFDDNGLGMDFYCPVRRQGQEELGFHVDLRTIEWWAKQTPEARAAAFDDPNAMTIKEAIGSLCLWLSGNRVGVGFGPSIKAWSHGSGFDLPILEHACRVVGIRNPISYADCRDTRTIYEIGGINIHVLRDPSTHHNALVDARVQALGVILARRAIKGWRAADTMMRSATSAMTPPSTPIEVLHATTNGATD